MVKVQLRAGGVRSDDDVVCFLRARPDSGVFSWSSFISRFFEVSSFIVTCHSFRQAVLLYARYRLPVLGYNKYYQEVHT